MAKKSKTDGMTGQQYGDWFESECQRALDHLMQKGPTFYHRLYDTRSAGSFLPAQAADFSGAHSGRPFLLECKGTVVHESLAAPSAMHKLLKDHQVLASYLMQRAGGFGLIAFRSRLSKELEIWDGGRVRPVYVVARSKLAPSDGLMVRCQCEDNEVFDKFIDLFQRALP